MLKSYVVLAISLLVPAVICADDWPPVLNVTSLPDGCVRENQKIVSTADGCGDLISDVDSNLASPGAFFSDVNCKTVVRDLESNGASVNEFCFRHQSNTNAPVYAYDAWSKGGWNVFQLFPGTDCNRSSKPNYIVTTWFTACGECTNVAPDLYVSFHCLIQDADPAASGTSGTNSTSVAATNSTSIATPKPLPPTGPVNKPGDFSSDASTYGIPIILSLPFALLTVF